MINMKKIILSICSLLFMALAFAQPEMEKGQYKGYILTKDGKQEGIIWLDGNESQPWSLQKKVYFITVEGFAKLEKNKRKYFTEYSSKDIQGYGYGEYEFEAVKYADMSAVGPDMMAKMYFLSVIVKGKMGVYLYYRTPPSITSGADIHKTDEEWAKDNDIVIKKGDGKAKSSESVDLVELINDCATVKDKYLSGGYGFDPKNNGSKGGLKKAFAKKSDQSKIEGAISTIAKEYNECK
jgi:hypothetical protein